MTVNTQNTQPVQAQGALATALGYLEVVKPLVEKVPYGWVAVKAVTVVGTVLGLRRAQQQPAAPAPANPPVNEVVLQMTAELSQVRREEGVRHVQELAQRDAAVGRYAQENIALQEEIRAANRKRNVCIVAMIVLLTGTGAATTYVATKMSRY